MAIDITIRHVELSKEAKDILRGKAEEFLLEFPNIENVHVIIDGRGHRKMAEVVAQGKPRLRVEASALADEIMPAADAAFQKTVTQLRKALEKVQNHRP